MMRPAKDVLSEVQEQLELATSKYGSLMERLTMFKKLSEQSLGTTEIHDRDDTAPGGNESGSPSYDYASGDEQDEFSSPHDGLMSVEEHVPGIGNPEAVCDSQFQYSTFDLVHVESVGDAPFAFTNEAQGDLYTSPAQWETQSLIEPKTTQPPENVSVKGVKKKKRAKSIRTTNSSHKLRFQKIYRGVQKKNNYLVASKWNQTDRKASEGVEMKRGAGNSKTEKEAKKKTKAKNDKVKLRSLSPSEIKLRFPNLERLSRPKRVKDGNETLKEKAKESGKATLPMAGPAESNVTVTTIPEPIFNGIRLADIVPTAPLQPPLQRSRDPPLKRDFQKKVIYEKIKETESTEYFEPQLVIHNVPLNGKGFEWTNVNYKVSCDSIKNKCSQSSFQEGVKKGSASDNNIPQRLREKKKEEEKPDKLLNLKPIRGNAKKGNGEKGVKRSSSVTSKIESPLVKTENDKVVEKNVNYAHRVSPRIAQACESLSQTLELKSADRIKLDKSGNDRGDAKHVGRRLVGEIKVRPWNAGSGLRERFNKTVKSNNLKKDSFSHIPSRVFQFMVKGKRDEKQVEIVKEIQVVGKEKKAAKPKASRYATLTRENVSQMNEQQALVQRDSMSEKGFDSKPTKKSVPKAPGTAPHPHKENPKTLSSTKDNSNVSKDHLHGGGDSEKVEDKIPELHVDEKPSVPPSLEFLFPTDASQRKSIYNAIPFIVGQSVTKSHNLGLSIQETLAALRSNHLPKDATENINNLEDVPPIPKPWYHKCPAMDCPPAPVDDADAWKVPQRDPFDDLEQPKRNICTCYSPHSQNLSTVVRDFLLQMIGNKLEEEKAAEKTDQVCNASECGSRLIGPIRSSPLVRLIVLKKLHNLHTRYSPFK